MLYHAAVVDREDEPHQLATAAVGVVHRHIGGEPPPFADHVREEVDRPVGTFIQVGPNDLATDSVPTSVVVDDAVGSEEALTLAARRPPQLPRGTGEPDQDVP